MKKIFLILVLLIPLICGCVFGKGLWNGITSEPAQSETTASKIISNATNLIDKTKTTGTLDIGSLTALLVEIKAYTEQQQTEKPSQLELFGTIIGLAAATYLGTRRLRVSPIGTFFNSILSLFRKNESSP